mgnify:CR=1 FL=1
MTVKKTGARTGETQQNLTAGEGKLEEQIRYDEANLPPWLPEGTKSPLRQFTEGGRLHEERQSILDRMTEARKDVDDDDERIKGQLTRTQLVLGDTASGQLRFVVKDGRAFIQFKHRSFKRWKTIFVIRQDGSLSIMARITQNASLRQGEEPQ